MRKVVLVIITMIITMGVVYGESMEVSNQGLTAKIEAVKSSKGSITLIELAEIINSNNELTYGNYEYYRKELKDTANRDIIKLYSEGIIQGDGKGNMRAERVLTDQEIYTILQRVDSRLHKERPEYTYRENIPVLMYHEVIPMKKGGPSGLYVHPDKFKEQLDALRREGFNTVTMEQVYQHWYNKQPLPEKPVVLTFDDGYTSHFEFAAKELGKRGMTGTFYLITGSIGEGERTSESMVKEMYREGMEIGAHTVTHIDSSKTNNEKVSREYKKSKEDLENILGIEIEHFCYPFGGVSDHAIETLKELGFKTSVVTAYGKSAEWQGIFKLKRLRVDYYDSIQGFMNKVR